MDGFSSNLAAESIIDAAAVETLTGDIRDALLTHVRSIRVPWAMLAEDEQRETIAAISRTAEHSVRTAASLIAQRGFAHVDVRVGKWTVKDVIKLEVLASGTVDNITNLAEHGAGGAVLVLVEASEFFGERAPAKPNKAPDLFDGEAA